VIVCEVAGRACVTVSGGQGGMSKAALLTLRVVYASAVIVGMRWPLISSPMRFYMEGCLCLVLAELSVALRRVGPCCCRLVWLGRGTENLV
jgi:hypothetical protein